ncbi:hypothetical protein SNOG_07386 [Parastagonospora nodorum SN15]|uniref:Uncharacterized protein n=1 Tax=Phaeosphaeria nodorum (strain SN15 / ATCC MYA-4574 / FGSC 10173) TaxID=321614 RepID=Q0ULH8_PHANO|nr:hypothetical protein SNOG_07386 [Parastagonospora nodorum SN15]EAT84852.1 hypothetical protein SNOG_07386 [Parastagonospora nodorum SN15]
MDLSLVDRDAMPGLGESLGAAVVGHRMLFNNKAFHIMTAHSMHPTPSKANRTTATPKKTVRFTMNEPEVRYIGPEMS